MYLNDYYLVRCFSKQKYQDDFNSGILHLNSTAYYWSLENSFQQDFEGQVIRQIGKGYLIKADSDFKDIVLSSYPTSEVLERMEGHGRVLAETIDFSVQINGYLACFYLLPKKDVMIENGKVTFTRVEAEDDLRFFFRKYQENTGSLYACMYDASSLCERISSYFEDSDYELAWGAVEYKDLSISDRVNAFNNGLIEELVFTKPLSYHYQKEFRFFVSSRTGTPQEDFHKTGLEIAPCLVGTFSFGPPNSAAPTNPTTAP